MRAMVTKTCERCSIEFEHEAWNKKRRFCSSICSNTYIASKKRYKNSEFIQKLKEKFGDCFIYDYIDVNNRINGKIKMICRIHGEFWTNPETLLNRSKIACHSCIIDHERKTTQQFILEAVAVHGIIYDYKNVNYITNSTPIEIICIKHGSFFQIPYQHTNLKSGCPRCMKNIRISKNEQKWLDSIGVPNDDDHRQVTILGNEKKYIVDGYIHENKMIYEYLGDYWHGNPKVFDKNSLNKTCDKTHGELYQEFLIRSKELKELGYNIKFMWESEWLKNE